MAYGDTIRQPGYQLAIAVVTYQVALYSAENHPAELDAAYRDLLKLMEDQMPAFAPPLQRVLQNYVDFLCARRNFAAAAEAVKHAIKIRERARKAKPESVVQARMLLAAVYEKEGKPADAEALYREILASETKTFGVDSDEATETSLALARFYMGHERYREAEPIYLRLAARMTKFQGEGVALSAVLSAQESLYLKTGRDAELEAVYKRQIPVYEKLYGPGHPALTQPLQGYAALLRRQNRGAEAQALDARVAQLKAPATR